MLKWRDEKDEWEGSADAKAKRWEEAGGKQSDEENNNKYMPKEDPNKFKILEMYDFPTYVTKEGPKHIVNYDNKQIDLFEIFGEYGTIARPKENPKFDPLPPPPKPKKEKVVKPPPEVVLDEEGNPIPQEDQPEEEEKEEEEEEFIPPLDRELFYDFRTHNGKDPILLALMIKGAEDEFTL